VCFQTFSYGQEQIELVHSDEFVSAPEFPGAGKLKGNVHFKTGNKNMYCDSAYFHKNENWVRAYSKVQINQGDTLNLFCDSLYFDGKTNIGILRSNVRFRDNTFKMTTDSLRFDANQSIGYYTNWATINSINEDFNLTSKEGYYYANSKTFFFKDSVDVNHPNYHLTADTLEFNTNTQTVYFHDSTIINFDSTTVYCQKGYYDTQNNLLNLWDGATIYQNNSTTIFADTLIYNQAKDIAFGHQNVSIFDSTKNIQLKSNYLYKSPSNQQITLANNARIYKYTNKDTLALKADTIYHQLDTISNLTTNIAVFNVEIYQGDIVGICDSIYFSETDSIIKMNRVMLFSDKRMVK
jgi:lipopolysaccharide assembly outer membrane protein LptD (OstA)